MDYQVICERCIDDRFRFMIERGIGIPRIKRYNVDLLAKFVYVMLHSVGKPFSVPVVFFDEVNNRSMIDNLYATAAHCDQEHAFVCMRELKNHRRHVKAGWVWPLVLLLAAAAAHLVLYAGALFLPWERINAGSTRVLVRLFHSYLKRLGCAGAKVYCMTDHNFYSHILCSDRSFESCVIQHGLLLDMSYYYPVYADHFLAWGERSRELMPEDAKVTVTGTYKFSRLKPLAPEQEGEKSLLYCVSIPNTELVLDKIEKILRVLEGTGYKLKVKMHPGSFFSTEELEKRYGNANMEIYKECLISDISFSMAIIENSTVLLDLLYMEKPFIIYDEKDGYFRDYQEFIPWTTDEKGLGAQLRRAEQTDFRQVWDQIYARELNGNKQSFWSE